MKHRESKSIHWLMRLLWEGWLDYYTILVYIHPIFAHSFWTKLVRVDQMISTHLVSVLLLMVWIGKLNQIILVLMWYTSIYSTFIHLYKFWRDMNDIVRSYHEKKDWGELKVGKWSCTRKMEDHIEKLYYKLLIAQGTIKNKKTQHPFSTTLGKMFCLSSQLCIL